MSNYGQIGHGRKRLNLTIPTSILSSTHGCIVGRTAEDIEESHQAHEGPGEQAWSTRPHALHPSGWRHGGAPWRCGRIRPQAPPYRPCCHAAAAWEGRAAHTGAAAAWAGLAAQTHASAGEAGLAGIAGADIGHIAAADIQQEHNGPAEAACREQVGKQDSGAASFLSCFLSCALVRRPGREGLL